MTRDFRGPIALVSLVAVFAYAFLLLLRSGSTAETPTWMASTATLIVGSYLGAKNEVGHRDSARDAARDPVRDDARDEMHDDAQASAVQVTVKKRSRPNP